MTMPFVSITRRPPLGLLSALAVLVSGLVAPAVLAQAPDPTNSSKVLELSSFGTFTEDFPRAGAIDADHPKDGSGRVFVSTTGGKLFVFSSSGDSLGLFLDLAEPELLPEFQLGLSYVAFHPDYGTTGADGEGRLYTLYRATLPGDRAPDYSAAQLPTRTGDALSQYVLAEWTVDPSDPNRADPGSRREVIRFELSGEVAAGHSVGGMAFNPFSQPGDDDYGALYFPMGDMYHTGGTPGVQYVQTLDNPFGKILRINPLANGNDPYSIPADNPFFDGGPLLDEDGMAEEIYAWGFRNPQNMSFAQDPNGEARLVVFDIGADDYEEVNIVDAGDNHGWPRYDGPVAGNTDISLALPPGSALEFPVSVYDHTIPNVPEAPPTTEFTAIVGGYVVSDPNDPDFQNQLVFGDLARGAFFHVGFLDLLLADEADTQVTPSVMNVSLDGSPPGAFRDLIGSHRGDARFGVDESGRLFVVSRRIDTVFLTDFVVPPAQVVSTSPNDLPAALALLPAVPNPAREAVTLRYTVPSAAEVSLVIYDALGRAVATPVDGLRQPGAHEATFDASTVAPGVYVVRLVSRTATTSRMLSVVR